MHFEEAKIALSSMDNTQITVPYFYNGQNLNVKIRVTKLNNLIEPILEQIPTPIHSALKAAGLEPFNIDSVLLVGGSSMIPAVKDKLEDIFLGKIKSALNPMKAESIGAATIYQKYMNNQIKDFEDVIEYIRKRADDQPKGRCQKYPKHLKL
ncbi:hypothetical protein TVAG_297010 [Trichomonas vaginalis G3]|uniref:DnaK protein n=1 Tax=Trichomonas vaginalis (strain ATCC PRA-98 / G3) TaxID=412133 RepID=A2DR96_TRIV3|nr:unfolded protein binding [Trichomonas vaginalis G3]EAY17022.1 hypothetical protein TVAG_297010 [Trichomonas vaginalis G3]KAI5517885.1 unfolded protein binding [Trichomonas vaginalis G3]|eukprot:XP_001329245.1 hypothetical protein [Trichomonas vaginalis G3]